MREIAPKPKVNGGLCSCPCATRTPSFVCLLEQVLSKENSEPTKQIKSEGKLAVAGKKNTRACGAVKNGYALIIFTVNTKVGPCENCATELNDGHSHHSICLFFRVSLMHLDTNNILILINLFYRI